jgi:hypothetical protein
LRVPLSNDEESRAFARGIVDLIGSSHLLRAEYLVQQAIRQSASNQLRIASEIPVDAIRIEGWPDLGADLLAANQRLEQRAGHRASLAILSLVNRARVERLEVERKFHVAFARSGHDRAVPDRDAGDEAPDPETKRPVFVTGLEALMVLQRLPWPRDPVEPDVLHQFKTDLLLCGLLLVIKLHQAVDHHLRAHGLPAAVSVIVEMDHVSSPAEAGVHDLGPQARRLIGPPDEASRPHDAGAEMLAERQAAHDGYFQSEINRTIAELRELYRLVRMFPFYRFRSRNRLGDLLTNLLQVWCQSQKLPAVDLDWRMSKPDFERVLRQIAEARRVASVDDALDVSHVNELHDRWLREAREKDFALGTDTAVLMSAFEVHLVWALRFGGPTVQDRWAHAQPYQAA